LSFGGGGNPGGTSGDSGGSASGTRLSQQASAAEKEDRLRYGAFAKLSLQESTTATAASVPSPAKDAKRESSDGDPLMQLFRVADKENDNADQGQDEQPKKTPTPEDEEASSPTPSKEDTPKAEGGSKEEVLDELRTPFSLRPRATSAGSGDLGIFFRRPVTASPVPTAAARGGSSERVSEEQRPVSASGGGVDLLAEELTAYETKQAEMEDLLKDLEEEEGEEGEESQQPW